MRVDEWSLKCAKTKLVRTRIMLRGVAEDGLSPIFVTSLGRSFEIEFVDGSEQQIDSFWNYRAEFIWCLAVELPSILILKWPSMNRHY